MPPPDDCLFCQIVQGKAPCRKAYEDDDLLVFHDLYPQAAVHLLCVPKLHLTNLMDAQTEHVTLLGRMLCLAPVLARQFHATSFWNVIHNGADAKQRVFHLHMHWMSNTLSPPIEDR